MLHNRNGIEVEEVWLYGVSKHIGIIVVRLKAIKILRGFLLLFIFYAFLAL